MNAGLKALRAFAARLRNPPVGYRHGRQARAVRRFPLLHGCYYWLSAHMTLRLLFVGLLGVAPTVFLMLADLENRAFQATFAILGWIAVCLATGWLARPRVQVESRLPQRVACGSEFETRYIVRNTGSRAARSLGIDTLVYSGITRLRLLPAWLAVVAPGEVAQPRGSGRARMRGVYTLPALRWDSDYPCGLWRWGRTDPSERLLFVYPRYTRLEALDLPLGPRNRNELSAAAELSREAFEFHGCREFRDGDSLRHVHPRSSARVGVPVVKEFQTEGRSRTALLVDTRSRRLLSDWHPRLLENDPVEAALALAAALVDALSETDRVLELLVAGPSVYRFVSAGRTGYLEEVLDILAAVEACRDDPLDRLEPVLFDEIRLIQSVCLVLTHWDARRAALVRDLDAWGVGLKIVLVTADGKRPPTLPADARCFMARAVLRGEALAV